MRYAKTYMGGVYAIRAIVAHSSFTGWKRIGLERTSEPMTVPQRFELKFAGRCSACGQGMPQGIMAQGLRPQGAQRWIVWHDTEACVDKMAEKGFKANVTPPKRGDLGPDPIMAAYDDA